MIILSIGEILWDVIGTEEHLGGAPFNFAVHAARLGHKVLFVSGVGDDERGRLALQRACELGVETSHIKTVPNLPTGTATVELDATGQPNFEIHRPAAYDGIELTAPELAVISGKDPDWLYFGTLHQVSNAARHVTSQLIKSNPSARRFYDVNLRPNCYTPDLVKELAQQADAAKLNEQEARTLAAWCGLPNDAARKFCRQAADRFGWKAVCVTRGAAGCAILVADDYSEAPAVALQVADAVGAGDAFAAAFLHGLNAHWSAARIAAFANHVGGLVASRPGATPAWSLGEIQSIATE